MRSAVYLLKKIKKYDPWMLWMILFYTVLSAVYPFVWVVTPARILRLAEGGRMGEMAVLVTGAGAAAVISAFLLSFLKGNYRMRMNNVRYHLIRDLMRYSLEMPYENTLNPRKLDRIHLANDSVLDPQSGAGGIILTMLQISGEILAAVGFLGLLFALSWPVLIFILAVVVLTFFLSSRASEYEYGLWEENLPIYRKRKILFQYAAEPGNQKDIRAYGLGGLLKAYIDRYHRDSMVLIHAASTKIWSMEAMTAVLDFFRDGVLYGWLILQFLWGNIDVSQFYLYTSGVISFVVLAQQGMTDMAKIRKESAEFSIYQQVMDREDGGREEQEADNAQESAGRMEKQKQEKRGAQICLNDVSFTYPGSSRPVLRGINLTITAGEKLALVGENGSGKSTLIKLLCRLYRPTEGTITMDGRDIWSIEEEEYMKCISAVFQDAMVFPFSVEENICLGKRSDPLFGKVMKQSGMDRIAAGLEKGEKTTLLRVLDDDGADLSGGQRQRLFLARALYRDSSRFLILDEPTAALDPLAERQLYEKYGVMTEHRTSVFVSHRLASTKFCDHIALLEDGVIKEYGTHLQLLERGGSYQELYEIQAKFYRQEKGDAIWDQ